MSQAALAPINPATTSGTDLATKLVNGEQAWLSSHKGSSRPTYVVAGMFWLDDTTTPWLYKFYDGAQDIVVFAFSAASHRKRSGVSESTVASAATTDVLGAAAEFVAVSGTASITSLGTEPNVVKYVRATGAFTLTHNATSLILPTGSNITAAADDTFIVASDASGNARVFAYQRATGSPLLSASADVPSGSIMLFRSTSAPSGWTKDTSNYNDHAIRIVTGTASSGGSLNFSTVFGYTATQSYTLVEADLPAHTHGVGTLATASGGSHTHSVNNGSNLAQGWGLQDNMQSGGGVDNVMKDADQVDVTIASGGSHTHTMSGSTASAGSGGGHTHNMDTRIRYVDCIFATKN